MNQYLGSLIAAFLTTAAGAYAAGQPGGTPQTEVAASDRATLYEENQVDPQNPKATPGRGAVAS